MHNEIDLALEIIRQCTRRKGCGLRVIKTYKSITNVDDGKELGPNAIIIINIKEVGKFSGRGCQKKIFFHFCKFSFAIFYRFDAFLFFFLKKKYLQ